MIPPPALRLPRLCLLCLLLLSCPLPAVAGVSNDALPERGEFQFLRVVGEQFARCGSFRRRNSLESVPRGDIGNFDHKAGRTVRLSGLVTNVAHVEDYTVAHLYGSSIWYNVCMVTMYDTVTKARLRG